ncbi:hypothetical protein OIU78_001847 [Salix suchowensis]|nr:hypothetical protein OIU78_001847 [Salix suchowensis]
MMPQVKMKLNRSELQKTIREYWEARGKYFLSYYMATMYRLLLPRSYGVFTVGHGMTSVITITEGSSNPTNENIDFWL